MSAPRLVVVHRRTELAEVLAEHATLAAAEFFLATRGRSAAPLVAADEAQHRAVDAVMAAAPTHWRQAVVERAQLSRFLFEPDDLVVVVGPDGLVPNVAKYLDGQGVLGVSPGPPGLLCRHRADQVRGVLTGSTTCRVAERAMVEASLDDGQRLLALNEVFVGDRGHQSARYTLAVGSRSEPQSSSGVIVGTGTGATGWLASLWRQARPGFDLPAPDSDDLAYFVREAWPSARTGTDLVAGLLTDRSPGRDGDDARVRVRAESSLVVFGDGIERDQLRVEWGQEVVLHRSDRRLRLLLAPTP
ncbi:ATP-NAD kinase [Salana multivorans]|uniref:ATP-NAD kinase n=1 Tax=Salana multivorans TaxID=120377 RepID=A0A3N2DBY7_9MICO|nr:NAD(+)/NADH kinase [Salana multivorans]OJX97712.1 MAG: hypothetical protein BGO96_12270 [Micrococcales bacterium 73-15]ROR97300.1 ATP-NAD kinase [Salana multivorans]